MRLFRRRQRPRRTFIDRIKDGLEQLEYVYDVRYEYPAEGRYLIHMWVNDLNERVQGILEPQIREIVRRRPSHIKVDVFLYRRDVG